MTNSRVITIFAGCWLIFISVFAVGQTRGGTSSKTFDFGAGGDNPTFRSHARSFTAPQGVVIVVAVNYRTAGGAPVPIVLEIEDSADKVSILREIVAEKTMKRIVLNIAAADNAADACEKPWQVRVRTQSGEIPAARIFGDISFSFVDPSPFSIEIEGEAFKLNKGAQTTRRMGVADSFKHAGLMSVKAGWLDSLAAQVLPLKFEVMRPDGTIAKTLTGYGTNSGGSPKLDFSYNVTNTDAKRTCLWLLKITTNTENDIIEINPKVFFTRKCFE